jgi:hypothetical protein
MALVVNGHIKIPRNRLRPLPPAPLVERRRYLLDRSAQAAVRGVAVRGAARFASQILGNGAQAIASMCVAGT